MQNAFKTRLLINKNILFCLQMRAADINK